MVTNQQCKEAYDAGRLCRVIGNDKKDCPFGRVELQLRTWWLAGWNDVDIELG